MNVSKQTINALYEIINQCFQMNRFCDSLVSVMGVNFAMNNTSSKVHEKVCHYFPQLSDLIGESCLERYNIIVEYGETKKERSDYSSVSEMIAILESRTIEFQNMFIGAMKVAFENNDLQVYSDLSGLVGDLNKIVGQLILLKDKIKFYGENKSMEFDHDIDTFWVL